MAYYVRVLSPSERVPSVAKMQVALSEAKLAGTVTVEAGGSDDWTHLVLGHERGPQIAHIERNCSLSGDVVAAETEEFLEEIADCKPASAAAWLAEYLPKVRTICAFQLLSGTDFKKGWDILGAVKDSIFSEMGGIVQADLEGFSNEEGYHILWQFADSVKGLWWMGVLRDGQWVHFQMDLGNKKHRAAFLRGQVPAGAKLAE